MAAPPTPREAMNKPLPAPTRLCYFNLTGLGEPVRFLLALGGEEFIDERLSMQEFGERKDRFPYGKLPYLEIDGLFLHQSLAICRYLGQKQGIAGKTREEAIEVDVMADTIKDVLQGLAKYHWEADKAAKEAMKTITLQQADYYLDRIEKTVTANQGTLVKGLLSWADVLFAALAGYMSHMAGKDLLASRAGLQALHDRVVALPAIAKYLPNRPGNVLS